MSKLNLGSITIIVNGYTLNNGLPYFQKAVPAALRSRIGKATIKIRLHDRDGHYAVQCHRLDQKYSALFRAMREDASLVPSETKLAGIALLETAGLRPGDGGFEIPFKRDDGLDDAFNPGEDTLLDFLMETITNNGITSPTMRGTDKQGNPYNCRMNSFTNQWQCD